MSHIPASAMPHAKPHDEPHDEQNDVPQTPSAPEPEAPSPDATGASGKATATASGSVSAPVLVIAAVGLLAIGGFLAATLALRGSEPSREEPKAKPKSKGSRRKTSKPD